MLLNLDEGGVIFRRANFILFLPLLLFIDLKIFLSVILEGSLSLDLRTLSYLSLLLNNQKRKAIRSSENQTDGVGSRTLILLMTPSLTIK